jgi:hypothetical protein
MGPTILEDLPPRLVPLARCPGYPEARDRHRLGPRRVPFLLAFAMQAARPTQDQHGDWCADPTLGGGEPGVGVMCFIEAHCSTRREARSLYAVQ